MIKFPLVPGKMKKYLIPTTVVLVEQSYSVVSVRLVANINLDDERTNHINPILRKRAVYGLWRTVCVQF